MFLFVLGPERCQSRGLPCRPAAVPPAQGPQLSLRPRWCVSCPRS